MKSIDTLSIILLSVAIVIVVAACVVIFSRSRKAQSAADKACREAAEEELRRDAEQEAVQRAEEEQSRLEDEAQRKAEELHLAAEEYRRSEQESERPEEMPRHEDKAQLKVVGNGHLEVEAEGKRLEPGKRGGRPRASTEARAKSPAQKVERRCPKPEVICWKRERQWVTAVEIPEEILENPDLTILQDGSPLTREESREACWRLEQVSGEVVVQWNEGEGVQETKTALGQDGYLLFKLSGQNQGRRVKSPSLGSYLVIVPDNWERDDTLSGPPQTRPEAVSFTGYQAHFFELEKEGDRKIAFCTPTGKSVEIKSKAPQFELVGNQLNDADADKGPLFGEAPPCIRALNGQGWKNVRTIVVGEEGSGKGRWRTACNPAPEQIQQELPPELVARKGGWYFLRFYDTNDDLIESLDFRFLCALKEIKVCQLSPLPPEDGHSLVCVEFLHEPGCSVQPVGCPASIQIERQGGKTILTIPPDPTYDETRWLVGPEGGPQVEVTILVERLWWAIEEEHNAPSEWKDQPLTLPRDDFAATSKKALWLRLPRRRWVDKVLVGFEEPKARSYPVKVADKTVAIPLRDFGDFQEVRGIGITPLKLWICPEGTTAYEGTLCELKIKLHCKFCDFDTFREEDMFCHVESLHMDEFFRLLTYEEMRARIPSLPPGIYKCSYCPKFVKSDDFLNPTSTIVNHIEQDCPNAPRDIGPVRVGFRIISDVDEIREHVIRDLPRIHKCKLCDSDLDEATPSDLIQHLIVNHRDIVYEVR
jgi:hypothetical protein